MSGNLNRAPGKLSFGAWKEMIESSNGEIAEFLVFNEALPNIDREKIESYLAHKWGLSHLIPNTHIFKNFSPIPSPMDLESFSVNLTELVSGNTYYYRVKATNSDGVDWADSTASFVSESGMDINSGKLSFNTSGPTPSWMSNDGRNGTGVLQTLSWTDFNSNSIQYKVAKYSFDQLNIGSGVEVFLHGDNPIHLDISGDANISAVLDLNGTAGDGFYQSVFNKGKLGGGDGGKSWSDNTNFNNIAPENGTGPAHLVGSSPYNSFGSRRKTGTLSGLVSGTGAGGGSYGGAGVVLSQMVVRMIVDQFPLPGKLMVLSTWMPCLPDQVVAGVIMLMVAQEPVRLRSLQVVHLLLVVIFMPMVDRVDITLTQPMDSMAQGSGLMQPISRL